MSALSPDSKIGVIRCVFHSLGKAPLVKESKNKVWTGIERVSTVFLKYRTESDVINSTCLGRVDIISNTSDTENEIISV